MDLISNGYENLKVLAKGAFPATITRIDNVVPVMQFNHVTAADVAFDFLAAVANHLYFIQNFACWESGAITGDPRVRLYDLVPTPWTIYAPNTASTVMFPAEPFVFATRLEHFTNGASGGGYFLSFLAFDMTYA